MASELDRLRGEVGAIVAKHEATKGRADFTKYARDPVGFLRDVLHFEPWSMQEELAALVRDEPRVCAVSANAMGKDAVIARIALWWAYAVRGFVILTSVTDRQARHVTMREVRKGFLRAPSLPGELFQMELRAPDESGILAFTSDNIEKLVGFHHPRLLLCLSEAQGLEPDVFEAAYACATGPENRILAYGNPTRPTGAFHAAATSEHWRTLTASALTHPNVVTGREEEIPGGPSRAWIESMKEEYGETSSVYRARVLAEWPDESVEGLLRRSWLLAAFARFETGALADAAWRYRPAGDTDNPLLTELSAAKLGFSPLLSADIARHGPDASCVAVIRGPVVEQLLTWHGARTTDSADTIVAHAERAWVNRRAAPPRLVVDDSGVGGGVTDNLLKAGWYVAPFNGANRSHSPQRFLNMRAQVHWHLRELLEGDLIALPRDAELLEEALAVEWTIAPGGALQIVSKDDIRKALGRSPDKLDSIVMGLAQTMPQRSGGNTVRYGPAPIATYQW